MAAPKSSHMLLRFAELEPEAKLRYRYLIVANETSADGQGAAASIHRLYPPGEEGYAVDLQQGVRVLKGGLKAAMKKAAGKIRGFDDHGGLDVGESGPVEYD